MQECRIMKIFHAVYYLFQVKLIKKEIYNENEHH
jgi:hypothetical protein